MNEEIINTIESFYKYISGVAGKDIESLKLKTIFTENSRLYPFKSNNKNSKENHAYDVDQYIKRIKGLLKNIDFFEKGYDYDIVATENIANVSSKYIASCDPDFKTIIKKGVCYIQLVKQDSTWKIFSMLWEDSK